MARMDDDAQQPVGRCGTSIHPQEDRQDHVIDLTVKQVMSLVKLRYAFKATSSQGMVQQ